MPLHARILRLAAWALLALPVAAHAQQTQTTDTGYNLKVARPMFTKRHPMLLVDRGHNNTHTTRSRYDGFALLAINDGLKVAADEDSFSVKHLENANVLVIVNPLGAGDMRLPEASNPAFAPEECDAIYQWVRAGGSLLLICDHAPMATAASRLAARFGVKFSEGYLVDPSIADTAFGASTLVFSHKTGTLGDHVILRGRGPGERVQRVRTYTGQSMVGPPGSVVLLKVTQHGQDLMIGAKGVSDRRNAPEAAQAIAFTVGRGRVVMIGEATIFAAQLVPGPNGQMRKVGMNSPGFDNRQLALNVLGWLGHGLNDSPRSSQPASPTGSSN